VTPNGLQTPTADIAVTVALTNRLPCIVTFLHETDRVSRTSALETLGARECGDSSALKAPGSDVLATVLALASRAASTLRDGSLPQSAA
jgi:hypothetical protein